MFAIPLIAAGEKPKFSVRLAAASGFGMTLLYVVLSVIPIVDVGSNLAFSVKIIAVVLGFQLAGAAYFWRAETRRRAQLQANQG